MMETKSCLSEFCRTPTIENISTYDFTIAKWFWLGAAMISVVLTMFVWDTKAKD